MSGLIVTAVVVLVLSSACAKPTGSSTDTDSLPMTDAQPNGSQALDSAGSGQAPDATAESAFEPPWLPNMPLDSVAGVLTLFASTLTSGANGLELYAAVRNDGEHPLCGAALQVEFYDDADQLIGSASTVVQSGRLYRLPDSTTTISCVAPGQTAMAAATSLPEGMVLADLKALGHRFPAFQIDDAEFVPSAIVTEVAAFDVLGGTAFRGTVTNASDAAISDPSVSVFPVNGVGRPLGVATSTALVEIPPGGTWSFETSAVAERGVDQIAFAAASFPATP